MGNAEKVKDTKGEQAYVENHPTHLGSHFAGNYGLVGRPHLELHATEATAAKQQNRGRPIAVRNPGEARSSETAGARADWRRITTFRRGVHKLGGSLHAKGKGDREAQFGRGQRKQADRRSILRLRQTRTL